MSSSSSVLMFWYKNESSWKIQTIRNIVSPRNEYKDYYVGQKVEAKCDGSGPYKGVIVHISDLKTKAEKDSMKEKREKISSYIDQGLNQQVILEKMGIKVNLKDEAEKEDEKEDKEEVVTPADEEENEGTKATEKSADLTEAAMKKKAGNILQKKRTESSSNISSQNLTSTPLQPVSASPAASPQHAAPVTSKSTPKRKAFNYAMMYISPAKKTPRISETPLLVDSEDTDSEELNEANLASPSASRSRVAQKHTSTFTSRLMDMERAEEEEENEMFKSIQTSLKTLERKMSKVDHIAKDLKYLTEEMHSVKKRIRTLEKTKGAGEASTSMKESEVFKGKTKTDLKGVAENETDEYDAVKKMLYYVYTEAEIAARSTTGRKGNSTSEAKPGFDERLLSCMRAIIKEKFGSCGSFTAKAQNVIKHARKEMAKKASKQNVSTC